LAPPPPHPPTHSPPYVPPAVGGRGLDTTGPKREVFVNRHGDLISIR
jgi:hypothetical protein